ncbi:MAG TPA: sugar phosphate isomerase/epimerase [Sphaerochaeta sp.]|jgi:sugar phosphate isomerase/epimerase|uniref:sugar phosphate isomerase/epimerase n=1 Tax=Sphaerochaeta sp. UBA5849 TaxID=1947475 RepID=UPI000E993802|nr:sugar phosphate isomerase/epimerase [Sphaerochaeta sp.]HBO35261.1 sugar phosphate isomerase/epimerase [Sphaerochaeta sp.]
MRFAVTATQTNIGSRLPFVFQGPFSETFPKIKACGFDQVEIHLRDSSCIDRVALKRLLDAHDLDVCSIGTGEAYSVDRLFLSSDDQAVREQAIQRVKEHLVTASYFNDAVVIIGLLRGNIKDCSSRQAFEANLRTSLEECLDSAETEKQTLVIELINRYEADFLHTIEEGLAFISSFNSPYLKLHIDSFHMNIEECNVRKAILKAGPAIGHVHVSDNDRMYVGHGHFDFGLFFSALQEAGYRGAVAIESLQGPDAVTSATHSLSNMKKCLALATCPDDTDSKEGVRWQRRV